MSVASSTVTLRPAKRTDDALLRRIYAGTREEELRVVTWSDEERDSFLRQQFDAQATHYRTYDSATFDVIEADGQEVGRLYVARWDEEIRIIDIAILPEHRGGGTGTTLLRELLAEGARTGKRVSIHVEKHNPALVLYERLGFTPADEIGVYLRMEASP